MPQTAKNLLIILFIPFLLGLGNDIYLNYLSNSEKVRQLKNLEINPKEFMLSDIGWVWQEYSPDSLALAQNIVGTPAWQNNLEPVLRQPTLLVAAILPICGALSLLTTFVLGIWPFEKYGKRRRRDKEGYGIYKKAKGKKAKYSRK